MTPGTQLGSYEITDKLGQGGMGEVWKARDQKLGREVAIKTLPEEFAQDEERPARFERDSKRTGWYGLIWHYLRYEIMCYI